MAEILVCFAGDTLFTFSTPGRAIGSSQAGEALKWTSIATNYALFKFQHYLQLVNEDQTVFGPQEMLLMMSIELLDKSKQ